MIHNNGDKDNKLGSPEFKRVFIWAMIRAVVLYFILLGFLVYHGYNGEPVNKSKTETSKERE